MHSKFVLSDQILRLILALPDGLRGPVCRMVGQARALALYDALIVAPPFQALLPSARRYWVRRQVGRYATGQDVGSTIAGFHPYLLPQDRWPRYPDLMLAEGTALAEAILPVLRPCGGAAPLRPVSAGLHVHAYFLDGLPQIRAALEVNRAKPRLYLTGPEANRAAVLQAFDGYSGGVEFFACGNVGRDVVPFLDMLPRMRAAGHDLIGHVHVKRPSGRVRRYFVPHWSGFLLSALIGNAAKGQASIDDILADLAMAAPGPSLYLPQVAQNFGWGQTRALAEGMFPLLHKGQLPDRFVFSPGTMFWATPDYLRAFEALDLPWETVAREPLPSDGTVLHAIERLFGALAIARGDRVVICPSADMTFAFSPQLVKRQERERARR